MARAHVAFGHTAKVSVGGHCHPTLFVHLPFFVHSRIRATSRSLPIRLRAKIKLQSSTAGVVWDTFQVMLSLAACVLYVVSTFGIGERLTEVAVELVFALFFSIDLCLNFFVADNRIRCTALFVGVCARRWREWVRNQASPAGSPPGSYSYPYRRITRSGSSVR